MPPYPEVRVYRAVAQSLVAAGVPSTTMTLVITDRPAFDQADAPSRVVPGP